MPRSSVRGGQESRSHGEERDRTVIAKVAKEDCEDRRRGSSGKVLQVCSSPDGKYCFANSTCRYMVFFFGQQLCGSTSR